MGWQGQALQALTVRCNGIHSWVNALLRLWESRQCVLSWITQHQASAHPLKLYYSLGGFICMTSVISFYSAVKSRCSPNPRDCQRGTTSLDTRINKFAVLHNLFLASHYSCVLDNQLWRQDHQGIRVGKNKSFSPGKAGWDFPHSAMECLPCQSPDASKSPQVSLMHSRVCSTIWPDPCRWCQHLELSLMGTQPCTLQPALRLSPPRAAGGPLRITTDSSQSRKAASELMCINIHPSYKC